MGNFWNFSLVISYDLKLYFLMNLFLIKDNYVLHTTYYALHIFWHFVNELVPQKSIFKFMCQVMSTVNYNPGKKNWKTCWSSNQWIRKSTIREWAIWAILKLCFWKFPWIFTIFEFTFLLLKTHWHTWEKYFNVLLKGLFSILVLKSLLTNPCIPVSSTTWSYHPTI